MGMSWEASLLGVATATWAKIWRDGWLWPIVLALCLMPGLGVALWIDPKDRDVTALLGYAAGWSVLLAPLALVVVSTLGLGVIAGPALLVAGAIATLARLRRGRIGATPSRLDASRNEISSYPPWAYFRRRLTRPSLVPSCGSL